MLNKAGEMCAMTWYLTGYENATLFFNLCCHEKFVTLSGICERKSLEGEVHWWCPEDKAKSCPSPSCHWSVSHRIAPGLVSIALPAGYRTVRIKPSGKIWFSVLRNCLSFFSGFVFVFFLVAFIFFWFGFWVWLLLVFSLLNLAIMLLFCLWDVHGIDNWHLQCRKKTPDVWMLNFQLWNGPAF